MSKLPDILTEAVNKSSGVATHFFPDLVPKTHSDVLNKVRDLVFVPKGILYVGITDRVREYLTKKRMQLKRKSQDFRPAIGEPRPKKRRLDH